MGLVRVTDATVEPVTLQELQAHLRIIGDAEDALLRRLITVARQLVEEWEWRAHLSQVWQWKRDSFPVGDTFYVPRPKMLSVQSIKYTDTAGTEQTISSANYTVDILSEPGRVTPSFGSVWPTPREQDNAVTVNFTAGYGTTPQSVPAQTRHMILLIAAHYYENREPVNIGNIVNEIPFATSLLRPAADIRALCEI